MALEDFANSPQQKAIALCAAEHPDWTAAAVAQELGISAPGTVRSALRVMRRRQARKDPAVHTHSAPDGYRLKGVSTLRKTSTGETQWVKTEQVRSKPDDIFAAFQRVVSEWSGRLPDMPAILPPAVCDSDLLAVYPLGDPHLGLVASRLTSAQDYDIDQAIGDLMLAMDHLVSVMPAADTALIVNVGDFYHSDDTTGKTKRSGHNLDVDPRWHRVLQLGVQTEIRLIERALAKHANVVVDNRVGNHDDHSSWMLSLCLDAYFKAEPRVKVVLDPHMFWSLEFGRVLIGTSHGHTCKPDALPEIMATDWPEAWGRTRYRHWYTGHVHHESRKDYRGCSVETLRVATAPDSWTHASGYRSPRSMVADVWHRELGHRTRHSIGI